jgi:hypothetical protein
MGIVLAKRYINNPQAHTKERFLNAAIFSSFDCLSFLA